MHRALAGRERPAGRRDPTMDGRAVSGEGTSRPRLVSQRCQRRLRGVLERGDHLDSFLARGSVDLAAEQGDDGRLAEAAELVLDLAPDLR